MFLFRRQFLFLKPKGNDVHKTKNFLLSFVILSFLLISCGSKKELAYNQSVKQRLEQQYRKYKGTPYKYGGTNHRGFDCSGFVQTVFFNAFGVELPRSTAKMKGIGKKVGKGRLIPGDLVFFRPGRRYQHVGIYLSNNLFIHSSTSKGVIKSNLNNPYWKKKYRFAKRILKTK
ncbi:MAG: bifunctional murein DD-endopeptidase/murein LD-carboxypeptidase [Flavobacteriales bacterium]|nr:MAG: bifunctional murein DD-endopeptidase/murein LD-carboxypeptidase [Flavobacteriales bacterium]